MLHLRKHVNIFKLARHGLKFYAPSSITHFSSRCRSTVAPLHTNVWSSLASRRSSILTPGSIFHQVAAKAVPSSGMLPMRSFTVLQVTNDDSENPIAIIDNYDKSEKQVINIQASYPEKPKAIQNLVKGLNDVLVRDPQKGRWALDASGEAIHRHLHFPTSELADQFTKKIKPLAEELNHDPHLDLDDCDLTVTCATHVPPGMSVKDVKLAKRIDELYYDTEIDDASEFSSKLQSTREEARKRNMKAVKAAKASCSCG